LFEDKPLKSAKQKTFAKPLAGKNEPLISQRTAQKESAGKP
jgi:hypothetical protein